MFGIILPVSNLITEIEVRSVVTTKGSASSLPFDVSINPYRGCTFGCSYCYASKFVYDDAQMKAEWGHWVQVKKNAVDALQRESHKLCGATIFFSSATDPYQPIEKRIGLSRAMIEVILLSYPKRLHIQTRSPHVVRDIDLFQRFGDTLTVGFSIPTDSDVVRKTFEPRAPSIRRRLLAARTLREAGIRTIGAVAPLLPCTPQRIAKLFRPCFETAWVGTMRFYEKGDALRALFSDNDWGRYLHPDHKESVKAALIDVGLIAPPDEFLDKEDIEAAANSPVTKIIRVGQR